MRNNHDGTFTDVAVAAGAAYNEDGREQAGMGVTIGDYNNDGKLDIFKTNFPTILPRSTATTVTAPSTTWLSPSALACTRNI